ncbi:MAG: hypothetical protein NTW96_00880 [Planctomycetia bacterium]|nr:hypothetical protein [Planctomycetia bacterium]
MRSRRLTRAALTLLVISAFAAALYADEAKKGTPPAEDVAEACRQAKQHFTPLTGEDLARVKEQLHQAVRRLEERLDRDSENGQTWRRYLKLDELGANLAENKTPDLEQLDAIYSRFDRQHEGLDFVWFVDVRLALRRYLNVARAIDNPEIKAAYEKLLDVLPDRLDAFAKSPTPDEAAAIGEAIGWLEDFRQADALVAALRERFRRPNLLLQVSRDLVAAGLAEPVDETAPVSDVILGTQIHGTGRTTGRLAVEFSPSQEDAVINTVLTTETRSETLGYNGPVRVYSHGLTQIDARKRIVLNDQGVEGMPAVSDASTESTFDGICAVRGGKIVERIAWKRAYRDKRRAEAIASAHAESRVNRRIDDRAGEMLAEANNSFHAKFRQPLFRHRLFPAALRFSTTADVLQVVGLEAGSAQLAAVASPPTLAESSDAVVRVHESMINNSAATVLSGRTLSEEQFLSTIGDILGKVPERLLPEEGKEPWEITFASRDPFVVTFAEDGFSVSMRAVGYTRGENTYAGMNVTARYKIEKAGDEFRAVRQGDIEVLPPGFAAENRKLSAREQTLRRLLQTRFAKIFDSELAARGILELPGRWSKVGPLRLARWTTADGWMLLAWNLPAKAK